MPRQRDVRNDIFPIIPAIAMIRHIRFFLYPGFQLLDLSGPLAAFQFAAEASGAYRFSFVSAEGGAIAASAGPAIGTDAIDDAGCNTFIVPGGGGVHRAVQQPETVDLVRAAASRADRIASVCTGTFLLAAAGLLDGRAATTHWRSGARLQAEYPAIHVDPDRIFVRDGTIWTSAGITAGIDLALAMMEQDLGSELSRAAARHLVVYHRRSGGQSQFSALLDLEPASDRIRQALHFARDHLHEPLPVERLAGAARLSPRQFGRAFLAETGQTPARAVERLRAEAARPRVEDGAEPLETIARAVGFADPERLRQSFIRAFGQPPQALRRVARASGERQHDHAD
jgi:transcriptional regulator GlxA family with amidase domain